MDEFKYCGIITDTGNINKEVKRRLALAHQAFRSMWQKVFKRREIPLGVKRKVYEAVVLGVLLYGIETWNITAGVITKLERFHSRCCRRMLGIARLDKVTNVEVRRRMCVDRMDTMIMVRQLKWLGHVERMGEDRLAKKLMYIKLVDVSAILK